MKREVSNSQMFGAKPPITENVAKTPAPMKKTRLRPNISASRPLRGVDAGAEGFLDGREGDRERGEVIGITNTATAMAIMPRIADLPRGASVSATVPVAS
jgi:hypothetical protein